METQEFWMTNPRFIQQVGDEFPAYVHATPQMPVKVCLPAKILRRFKNEDGTFEERLIDQPEDANLKRIRPATPQNAANPRGPIAAPKPNHAQRTDRAADK